MSDDLWDEPEDTSAPLIRNGRYALPNRDGTERPKGRQRMTNFIDAMEDAYAIKLWEFGRILEGVAARRDIIEEICSVDWGAYPADKKGTGYYALVKELVGKIKNAAKADEGARRGTAHHAMMNVKVTTGREVGTEKMRVRMRNLEDCLRAHQFRLVPELQERYVILDRFDVAGQYDSGLLDINNQLILGDLKTQAEFRSLMKPQAQLAGYVNADAMWDSTNKCYVDMPKFDKDLGILMHMDKDGDGEVRLIDADLKEGWETVEMCAKVIQRRRRLSSAPYLRAAFRPIPPRYIDLVESFVRSFDGATTPADARALREEAVTAGVWGPEVQQAAREAKARILNAGLDTI